MTRKELTEALRILGYDENGRRLVIPTDEEIYRLEGKCLIIDFRKWKLKNADK